MYIKNKDVSLLHINNELKTYIMKTLSLELQNRVKREIIATQRQLDLEMKFSEDLRNLEMVDFYENHLVKLNNML